jgi:NADH:ubiquinone oxidoreductase subunit B-like Fe-S oxidoreductase
MASTPAVGANPKGKTMQYMILIFGTLVSTVLTLTVILVLYDATPYPKHVPAAWYCVWASSGGGIHTGRIGFLAFPI